MSVSAACGPLARRAVFLLAMAFAALPAMAQGTTTERVRDLTDHSTGENPYYH